MPWFDDALQAALDDAAAPVVFFLRDDDAGWDDEALFALLDCTEAAGAPLDLAVIPQATGHDLAARLQYRARASTLLGFHQHGYAHLDHQGAGRKSEFGDARSVARQRDDLRAGRARLDLLFDAGIDPFFTPPWNRCSAATPPLLAELGYAALSRDRGAPPQQALPELPVAVDWCRERRRADTAGQDVAAGVASALAASVRAGGPVGLMLHHAAMDAIDLARLAALLHAVRRHPQARWTSMRALLQP
jgi:predicted deacetylase